MLTIRFYSESDRKAWDSFVLSRPDGTFFHLTGWKKVIEKTFGHKSYYLIAVNGQESALSPQPSVHSPQHLILNTQHSTVNSQNSRLWAFFLFFLSKACFSGNPWSPCLLPHTEEFLLTTRK